MFGDGAADFADKLVNIVLKQLTAVDLSPENTSAIVLSRRSTRRLGGIQ